MKNGVKLKDLKRGEYFTLLPISHPTEKTVLIKGDYNRSTKKYDCGRFYDISVSHQLNGDRAVYTDFIF